MPAATLDTLRATLLSLRIARDAPAVLHDAAPLLTSAKQQLRDWIESRLTSASINPDRLARDLNAALRDAGLLAVETPASRLGFLSPLRLRLDSGLLLVQTGLGIPCGFDDSAYLYRWSSSHWLRIWQSERNNYAGGSYDLQTLVSVQTAGPAAGGNLLVLTLGYRVWCISAWQPVYFRLWRVTAGAQAAPLLDHTRWAYLQDEPPIRATLSPSNLLVQYTVGSLDILAHSRKAVEHYRLAPAPVTRIAPFALRPRDFVEEWLQAAWSDAAKWTEPANRAAVRPWHQRLHQDNVFGHFHDPTTRCRNAPDLWQVGIEWSDHAAAPPDTFFQVRWRPPYDFSLVRIADTPWPACTEADRTADDPPASRLPFRR